MKPKNLKARCRVGDMALPLMADQPLIEFTPEGFPSFARRTTTKRGRYIETDWFAPRDNDYGGGWRDGEACAREYLDYLIGKGSCSGNLPDLIRSLGTHLQETDNPSSSRYGAAVGFLRALEGVLRMVANDRALLQAAQRILPTWAEVEASDRGAAAKADRQFQRFLTRTERAAPRAMAREAREDLPDAS